MIRKKFMPVLFAIAFCFAFLGTTLAFNKTNEAFASAEGETNAIVDFAIRYEDLSGIGIVVGLVIETDAEYTEDASPGLDNHDPQAPYFNLKEYLWVNGRSVIPAGAGGFFVSAQKSFNNTYKKTNGEKREEYTINAEGEHYTVNFNWQAKLAGDLIRYDGTDIFVIKAGMPTNTFKKDEDVEAVLDRDYYFRLVWGETPEYRYFEEITASDIPAAKIVASGLRDADNGTHYGLTLQLDAAKFQEPQSGIDNPNSEEYLDFRKYVFINGLNQSLLPPTVTFISAGAVYSEVYTKPESGEDRVKIDIDYGNMVSININWPVGNLGAAGLKLDGTDIITVKKEMLAGTFDGKSGPYTTRTLDRDYYFGLSWDKTDKNKRYFYEISPEEIAECGYDKQILSIDKSSLPDTSEYSRKLIGIGQNHNLPDYFNGYTKVGGTVIIPVSYDKLKVSDAEGNDEITGTLDFSGLDVPTSEPNVFTVYYSVSDYAVSVDLGEINAAAKNEVTLGKNHSLPATVNVKLFTGKTETFAVRWSWTRAVRNGNVPITGTIQFGNKLVSENVTSVIELELRVTGDLIIDKLGTLPESSQTVLVGKEISLPSRIPALLINGEITSVTVEYEWTKAEETGKKQNKMRLISSYAFAEGIATEYVIDFEVKDYITSIGKIPESKAIKIGEKHTLPGKVTASLARGGSVELDVVWKWTTATQVGDVSVVGTIYAGEYEVEKGVSLKITKKVKVSESEQKASASGKGCKSSYEGISVSAFAAIVLVTVFINKKSRRKVR